MKQILLSAFALGVIIAISCSVMAQKPTHRLCVNNRCVEVQGEGTDTCRNDDQCAKSCEERGGYCCERGEYCPSDFVSLINCGDRGVCCSVPCVQENASNETPQLWAVDNTLESGKIIVAGDGAIRVDNPQDNWPAGDEGAKTDGNRDEIDIPFVILTLLVAAVLAVVLYQSFSRKKPKKESMAELAERKKLLQDNIKAVKESFIKRRITEAKANEKIAEYEQEIRLLEDQIASLKDG